MSPLLVVENLSVVRGSAQLLSDVSFAANTREFIGIVGPNGAGKSTLLRAITGLEPAASGACLFGGAPVAGIAPRDRARRLAFLPQLRETAWDITAEALVALGRYAFGAPHRLSAADETAIARAMKAADAQGLSARIVNSLSGGEQARVHLARLLASETPVLIADEPVAALDLRRQLAIMATLRKRADDGALVLAALHELDLALRFCTRLLVIHDGRLVADGAPAEALSAKTIATVFGVRASALRGEDGESALSFFSLCD